MDALGLALSLTASGYHILKAGNISKAPAGATVAIVFSTAEVRSGDTQITPIPVLVTEGATVSAYLNATTYETITWVSGSLENITDQTCVIWMG